jgi:hypothetical protein
MHLKVDLFTVKVPDFRSASQYKSGARLEDWWRDGPLGSARAPEARCRRNPCEATLGSPVGLTTGIQLRDPSVSEGLVSCNAELCRQLNVSSQNKLQDCGKAAPVPLGVCLRMRLPGMDCAEESLLRDGLA